MHRWTAMFLPPIISIFEQDIAMLRYIKTSDMCKKFMKPLPVNINPLAKPCISAFVRRLKTETNEKKKQHIPDSRSSRFNVSRCISFREKMHRCHPTHYSQSLYVRESRFWNPGNFCLRNQESWLWRIMLTTEIRNPSSTDKKSGILYLEPGILIKIWIQNPSSTDTDWNPVPGIRDPLRGIQNPRLYWISLHGAEPVRFKVMLHETVRN